MGKKEERKGLSETAIDTTINIHKLAHRTQFKHKAARAVSEVRKLVAKMMKTSDVRVDPKLNQFIWNQGVRNLPRRVRVRISRKRTEDEGKGSEWYSLVQHINTEDFSGKLTEKAKVSAWSIYLKIILVLYFTFYSILSMKYIIFTNNIFTLINKTLEFVS